MQLSNEKYLAKLKWAEQKELKKPYIEFPYLEELNNEQIKNLKTKNWVVVNPGKNNLLYMKDKNMNKLRYSNNEHIFKTKRLKYQKTIEIYRKKADIIEIETELSTFNSKTCSMDNYTEKKNDINKRLVDEYNKVIFRRYKWYSYIERKKAETDLIRKIKKTFGDNIILVYGDWSQGKQMRNFISTPNISLKRKLREHFTI